MATGSGAVALQDASIDLVCGAMTGSEKPQFFSEYDGRTYPFCSPECKRKFDDHPDRYIQQRAREKLGL